MITISYYTPTHRYELLTKYALDHRLTINDAISTMIDDFLCRQRLLADEASMPIPQSQDST